MGDPAELRAPGSDLMTGAEGGEGGGLREQWEQIAQEKTTLRKGKKGRF